MASVHAQSFERSQAERVSDRWERWAKQALDMGHIDLHREALYGAINIRIQRTLDGINAAATCAMQACKQHPGYSDVCYTAGSP